MIPTFVITLREGVEAALVIAIAVAYVKRIGRLDLMPAIYRGLLTAVVASFIAAWGIAKIDLSEEFYEGWMLLISAVFVLSMVIWMNRHGAHIRTEIESGLQKGATPGSGAWAVFAFVFLMIFREGIETVLLLAALHLDTSGVLEGLGAIAGIALAILFGVSFVRGTIRVNLRQFFRITTVILMVVVAQLTITGLHELSEGQILPSSASEMALIGPIVKNDVFFFITILALAAAMVLFESRGRRSAQSEALEGAALRKARWTAQRERLWMIASCTASCLFILLITAEFIYARAQTSLSTPTQVVFDNATVRIPVGPVSDGLLHRFVVNDQGSHVRFIVIAKPDKSLAVAYDACEICGTQGFYQKGHEVICRNCASNILVSSIGAHGGCNPIPLESHVDGDAIVIAQAAFDRGVKMFRGLNMIIRFVRDSIRRSPKRKALIIAAIALGTSVATAMVGVMLSIGDKINLELREAGANIVVTSNAATLTGGVGGVTMASAGAANDIPESELPNIKKIFWALNITGVSPTLLAHDGAQTVQGVQFSSVRAMNPAWQITHGRWAADNRGDDCMAGAGIARRYHWSVGTQVAVLGQTCKIAGIISSGEETDDRILLSLSRVQSLVGKPGMVDHVDVGALTKPEDDFAHRDPKGMTPKELERWMCTNYVSSIARQIQDVMPGTQARPVRRIADSEGKVLDRISGLMALITLAALLSAGLSVWSLTATTMMERRGEIAIMQAIGGARWLVATLLGSEIALIGLVGGIAGALTGVWLARVVGESVFHDAIEISPILPFIIMLAAMLVALAGAAQPLRRALRLEPAVILREGA